MNHQPVKVILRRLAAVFLAGISFHILASLINTAILVFFIGNNGGNSVDIVSALLIWFYLTATFLPTMAVFAAMLISVVFILWGLGINLRGKMAVIIIFILAITRILILNLNQFASFFTGLDVDWTQIALLTNSHIIFALGCWLISRSTPPRVDPPKVSFSVQMSIAALAAIIIPLVIDLSFMGVNAFLLWQWRL